MHSRIVKVELPDIHQVKMPSMELQSGRTLPMELMELTRDPRLHSASGVLKKAAMLLEALRLGLMAKEPVVYDRSLMSEGEIAIAEGQVIISDKLSTIISMMEKREARENPQATANPPHAVRDESHSPKKG